MPVGLAEVDGDRGCFWPGYGVALKAVGDVVEAGGVKSAAGWVRGAPVVM